MMAPDPERRIADYRELARRIEALSNVSHPLRSARKRFPICPSPAPRPRRRLRPSPPSPIRAAATSDGLNWLSLAIGSVAVVLVILGTIGRRDSPGERDLVESGRIEQLFNGRNIDGWQAVSGGWNPAKNNEGAIVLQGRVRSGGRCLPAAPRASRSRLPIIG